MPARQQQYLVLAGEGFHAEAALLVRVGRSGSLGPLVRGQLGKLLRRPGLGGLISLLPLRALGEAAKAAEAMQEVLRLEPSDQAATLALAELRGALEAAAARDTVRMLTDFLM